MAKTDSQWIQHSLFSSPLPPVSSLCPCPSGPSRSGSARAGRVPESEGAAPRGWPNLAAAAVHLSSLSTRGRAPSATAFSQRCSRVAGEEWQKACRVAVVQNREARCTGRTKKKKTQHFVSASGTTQSERWQLTEGCVCYRLPRLVLKMTKQWKGLKVQINSVLK